MQGYIDLHCDTLMLAFWARQRDIYRFPKAMVDVERLKQGGCMAQFFAIFLPPRRRLAPFFLSDETYIDRLAEIFQNTLARHGDSVAAAYTARDIRRNAAAGKLSCILSMEDGRGVRGSLDALDRYYALGVRALSLTWNKANCLGFPNSRRPAAMARGLTDFGRRAVAHMNDIGMLVDVSHLSDGGFWDVARLSQKPFAATHSNCRALNPHPRSLSDEMIRALAEKGGVAGLNLGGGFLSADPKSRVSRVDDMVAQVRHMVKVGGIGCPAIGSDFDGIRGTLEVGGPQQMPLLFHRLSRAGFSDDDIDRMASGNALRLLADTMRDPGATNKEGR